MRYSAYFLFFKMFYDLKCVDLELCKLLSVYAFMQKISCLITMNYLYKLVSVHFFNKAHQTWLKTLIAQTNLHILSRLFSWRTILPEFLLSRSYNLKTGLSVVFLLLSQISLNICYLTMTPGRCHAILVISNCPALWMSFVFIQKNTLLFRL